MTSVQDYLEPDEKAVAEVRRHWINVAPVLAGLALVAIAVLYGLYFLGRYADSFNRYGLDRLALVALIIMMVMIVGIGYASWWVYRESCVIITTRKLIQVTQNGLFGKSVSQFSLDHMQDVSARQNGLLPTSLNYGDVVVETAGEMENFIFKQAPNPKEIARLIMKMHEEYSPEHQRQDGLSRPLA